MKQKDYPQFYPKSRAEWRTWLIENHEKEHAIWVLFYKKNSDKPSLTWDEAVSEALCFGWIDSVKQSVNSEAYRQFFSQRKPKSMWSKINKEKIANFTQSGLMFPKGLAIIEEAKKNGSWTFLDSIEALEIPKDLNLELNASPKALTYYSGLSNSKKKQVLSWLKMAQRAETRAQRLQKFITAAEKTEWPKGMG